MKLRVAALALSFGLCFANPGLTRNAPIRSVQLRFAPGTVGTTVSGLVTGPDLFACTRTAEAGQHISIDLVSRPIRRSLSTCTNRGLDRGKRRW
jgi:hypothetical protein